MMRPDLKEFYANTRDAKKIIVVDLGFLGDTVHLIPALWEIKNHYPQAELHVLTSPLGAEVLKLTEAVDRVWKFPLGPPSPKWWEHWDLLRALRRERFDAAFNFSGADRSIFVTAIIRPRHAMAYQSSRRHFWQPWLVRNWIGRTTLPTPVYEARRHILGLCGFNLQPARFTATVPPADRQWARENIPAGAWHLSLSASFALKEWPLANSIALAKHVLANSPDRKLIVSAAPNPREQTRLEQFRKEISNPRVVVISERLSIPRVAAMLERCVLHVGPDSGMIHLAWILNIPTVSIFRRYSDMADFLPTGPQHVYFDAPCPCMQSKTPPCAQTGEAACLGAISAETVGREVCRRLALTAAPTAAGIIL